MLQAFVITLREGIEAFLIIAISIAYLRKRGHSVLIKAVNWGVAASVAVSVAAGLALKRVANQSMWEGILAIVAAVLVGTLIVHMMKTARFMKSSIEKKLEQSAEQIGPAAFWGVFFFTVFMITREGMETALLIDAMLFQIGPSPTLFGALLGLLAAVLVAYLWSKHGHKIHLGRFLQVTSIFLLVFVVQLLIYGFHELIEAGVLPLGQAWHDATEPYGPDGVYGHYLSYALVALPLAWLGVSWLRDRFFPKPR